MPVQQARGLTLQHRSRQKCREMRRGGSPYHAVKCKFTVRLWLLTNTALPETAFLLQNTPRPSFCLPVTPSFLKIRCQETLLNQVLQNSTRDFLPVLTTPPVQPGAAQGLAQSSPRERKLFPPAFLNFQDVTVCCGKAPSHCLETEL